MSHIVVASNVRWGFDQKWARKVQKGDIIVIAPPWAFKPNSLREKFWNILVECCTLEEFVEKGAPLSTCDYEPKDFLSWLRRNWWLLKATQA